MPDQTQVFTPMAANDGGKRKRRHQPMKSRLRPKLTYSNVIASIALFVALGGAAVAAGLPKHSVGAQQLKKGAVTAAALKKGAVTSGKLAPKSVVAGKLGPNAVSPGNIGNGAITSAKLGAGSVIASTIKNGVITNPKLGNGVVNTAKLTANAVTTPILANGSVTPAKLSSEIGGTVSSLKSGQTLRGVFDVGSTSPSGTPTTVNGAVSYALPLNGAATVTVLKKGEKTANCGGLSGGNEQTPQATAGNLCIYLTTETNLDSTTPLSAENNTRLGFGLVAKSAAVEGPYTAYGQWAVTAP
jgi:trimeric autotransporter adhesin